MTQPATKQSVSNRLRGAIWLSGWFVLFTAFTVIMLTITAGEWAFALPRRFRDHVSGGRDLTFEESDWIALLEQANADLSE